MDSRKELEWDSLLRIKTSGRDDTKADQYNYPYEPTPYCVLERLANSGYIGKKNTILDYGCGKGRVDFFLAYQTRCKTIGIEYDERIYSVANDNWDRSTTKSKQSFVQVDAREFEVPEEVDRIYFFNPFSEEVLVKVLSKIKESYYNNMREILLFFYYPSDEYISTLMTDDSLMFYDEIDCRDLFDGSNKRERIVIFSID